MISSLREMNLDPKLQEMLRNRPDAKPAMFQKWRDLSFLHCSLEPEIIQALLPDDLTIDTFDGRAWVGLVPFWMTGIRFPWIPPVPGTHTFPETNVRTYVHRNGQEPGVWFFSLDAANSLAVWWAKRFFGLPYHLAEMMVSGKENLQYRSIRHRGEATHEISIKVGTQLPMPVPGSLEFFLVERYLLYAEHKGQLYTGLVHHKPYEIRDAEVVGCKETMLQAAGIPSQPWEHICYSPGVDVEVFAINPVR